MSPLPRRFRPPLRRTGGGASATGEPRAPRRRRLLAAVLAGAALVAGLGGWAAAEAGSDGPPVHREDRFLTVPGDGGRIRLDTSFFTAGPAAHGRPAVLLAHGFGGSKSEVRKQAEELARHGYAVLTWSARGFGRSGGRIGLDAPGGEIADESRLIDWLARRPEVQLDRPGDPRVGIAGASYGGAAALLGAAEDHRVDAIAPQITWWNLPEAFFPQGGPGGPGTGVFKKLWAGIFFSSGTGTGSGKDPVCGRFEPAVCAAFRRAAETGRLDGASRKLLEASSPSSAASRIRVPALVVQGQRDSLFPLDQGDAIARALRANGAPVDVDWIAGGHDGGDREDARVQARVTSWFDHWLKGRHAADTGPAFRVSRGQGLDSTGQNVVLQGAEAPRYPGLSGTAHRSVRLAGRAATAVAPAGGTPPSVSALPGFGALGGSAAAQLPQFPGQSVRFTSAPLHTAVRVTGAPTVRLRVDGAGGGGLPADGAVLFAKVYDVAADGSASLPSSLAAPVRITRGEAGRTVTVRLPAVDHAFPAGHRLRLELTTTDLAYTVPVRPAAYRISLAPGDGTLRLPTVNALRQAAVPLPWWVWGLPAAAAAAALLLLLTARRRALRHRVPEFDGASAEVPLRIEGLGKRYRGAKDRWAVRGLSFGAEPGQVVGLLGPNGAGKTTTLRMLMGLIRPDTGTVRVFGHAVRAGAPVLSRTGAFVEGPGFLPHLTGRQNLDLYWRATGRPAADAHLDDALAIADLGTAVDRAVRTYSQGMRQRLAIAQAMLGLPELLILDEPANGLDPPQIREMREVLIRYARDGRTVLVSSHLLSEVEQTCTHLVVMDRGRLVAAGPTAEIAGADGTLFVATAEPVGAETAEELAALPGVASALPADGGLLVRLDGLPAPRLVAELVRRDVPVERIGPHRRLEDAFLTLIGGAP